MQGDCQTIASEVCFRDAATSYNPATHQRGGTFACTNRSALSVHNVARRLIRAIGLFLLLALLPTFRHAERPNGSAEFNPKRDIKQILPVTSDIIWRGPRICFGHQLGTSCADIIIGHGSDGHFAATGRSAPVPFTLDISTVMESPGDTWLPTRNYSRKLTMATTWPLHDPLTTPANAGAVPAIAKAVLAATCCIGGQIGENTTFAMIDDSAAKPALRHFPKIMAIPTAR